MNTQKSAKIASAKLSEMATWAWFSTRAKLSAPEQDSGCLSMIAWKQSLSSLSDILVKHTFLSTQQTTQYLPESRRREKSSWIHIRSKGSSSISIPFSSVSLLTLISWNFFWNVSRTTFLWTTSWNWVHWSQNTGCPHQVKHGCPFGCPRDDQSEMLLCCHWAAGCS